MGKLERYLELNWPCLSSRAPASSVEDQAIHVMRSLDDDLGGKDHELAKQAAEITRLRSIEDALLAVESLPPGREKVSAYVTLAETLRANPRPESSE